ncbi:MAG: histidinol-phosphate transaminase [Fimbriiglobus sp.]
MLTNDLVPGLRPDILAMSGYTPGEQLNDADIIKLNTNECPYPPSPRVVEAIQAALTSNQLRKYPQPLGDQFRRAARYILGVDPDGIVIGNGSDDILTILTRAYVPAGGRMLSFTPSYVLYKSLAEIQGAKFEAIPFADDWQLPDPWTAKPAHLTLLPNPNSPSGTVLRLDDIAALIGKCGPFVLDEAYADFAENNGLSLIERFPNLVVTRTMSKFYALAGIRFGFAVTTPKVARELIKVKDSYNCDVLSLAAATAAIQDQAYYADLRSKIVATRGRMTVALSELGFHVTPSSANFIWCTRKDAALKPIYDKLKAKKILVRHMIYPQAEGLRISVGTPQEIEKLLAELRRMV